MSVSIEHKIAGMLMVGFDGYTVSDCPEICRAISEQGLGGIILFDLETENYRLKNIKSAEQVSRLVEDLKALHNVDELIVGIDYEGGLVNRLKPDYGFPLTYSHEYLGELNDLSFTYRHSAEMASLLRRLGINLNFAPVVDINSNPDNPVIGMKQRSFSNEPLLVTAHATQFIKAHLENGIIPVIKHFPGHGSSSSDSHLELADVSDTWNENELEPFKSLINMQLTDCIMTAHVFNKHIDKEYPATLSYKFINNILREELGFKGVVFSDDLNMNAIKNNYGLDKAVEKAINAGVDILLISHDDIFGKEISERMIELIIRLLLKGMISESMIDHSFIRVMDLKQKIKNIRGTNNE